MNRHDKSKQWINAPILGPIVLFLTLAASIAEAAPPRLSIFHFDVNTGDATLIISPDGHGVLIDAGTKVASPYFCHLAGGNRRELALELNRCLWQADHVFLQMIRCQPATLPRSSYMGDL